MCEPSYAYLGLYCTKCAPGELFSEWSAAKRGGILFLGVALLLAAVFLLLFVPLFPRVEELLALAVQPVTQRMEAALGTMTRARTPTHNRPASAGRPGSRQKAQPSESAPPDPRTSHIGARFQGTMSQARRRSQSLYLLEARAAHDGGGDGTHDAARALVVERPSRVYAFFDTSACPFRVHSHAMPCRAMRSASDARGTMQSASRFASLVRKCSALACDRAVNL